MFSISTMTNDHMTEALLENDFHEYKPSQRKSVQVRYMTSMSFKRNCRSHFIGGHTLDYTHWFWLNQIGL